jgi:hypothetical protein
MTPPFSTEVSTTEGDKLADIDTLVDEFSIPRVEAAMAVNRAHEVLGIMRDAFDALEGVEPKHRRALIKTLVFAGIQNFTKQMPVPAYIALQLCSQAYSENQPNG